MCLQFLAVAPGGTCASLLFTVVGTLDGTSYGSGGGGMCGLPLGPAVAAGFLCGLVSIVVADDPQVVLTDEMGLSHAQCVMG